jgi:phytoene dehydrogenase-like protein
MIPSVSSNLILQSYKILIVGAGIGGLVAGIALSKKGHKVTILEAASQLGEVFPSFAQSLC